MSVQTPIQLLRARIVHNEHEFKKASEAAKIAIAYAKEMHDYIKELESELSTLREGI